jgi:hypothetical protein
MAGVQATRTVEKGTTFFVDILIGSVSDLQAFNFELVYDQTVISAPTITTGPDTDRNPDASQTFLSSTGRTWSCSPPAPSGDIDPSPTVGAAFLSCYSTGAAPGPDVGTTETLLARVQFDAIEPGTTALTLRNLNTFRAGGIETGSCNPTVIVAATCTGASVAVSLPVGGIAELPDMVGTSAENTGGPAGGSRWPALGYAALAGGLAAGVVTIATGARYVRRRWLRRRA